MAWQRFDKYPTNPFREQGAFASINSHGVLHFSRALVRERKLDQFTHAIFWFDTEQDAVGVQFAGDGKAAGARTLCTKNKALFVRVRAFCQHAGLLPAKGQPVLRLATTWDADSGMLVLFRNEEGAANVADQED